MERLCLMKEQKLVAFNFKILNDILATQAKLCKWKVKRVIFVTYVILLVH